MSEIRKRFETLRNFSEKSLNDQGLPLENIKYEYHLNLRYQGTDCAIMTLKPASSWNFKDAFLEQYQTEFGFTLPGRKIIIDDVRVRAIGKSPATGEQKDWTSVHEELKTIVKKRVEKPCKLVSAFWENIGRIDTPLHDLTTLSVGSEIVGPAIIIDATSTIAIEPYCSAIITSEHVAGFVNESSSLEVGTKMDPIMLSIFGHRFMSIAEQMGRTLQKTSVSTNIKERLDFSCALFGPDGGLVANAPHIPVHLGSMQEAVKWQMQNTVIKEGDVILSNHPAAGGSHLPDVSHSFNGTL